MNLRTLLPAVKTATLDEIISFTPDDKAIWLSVRSVDDQGATIRAKATRPDGRRAYHESAYGARRLEVDSETRSAYDCFGEPAIRLALTIVNDHDRRVFMSHRQQYISFDRVSSRGPSPWAHWNRTPHDFGIKVLQNPDYVQ